MKCDYCETDVHPYKFFNFFYMKLPTPNFVPSIKDVIHNTLAIIVRILQYICKQTMYIVGIYSSGIQCATIILQCWKYHHF